MISSPEEAILLLDKWCSEATRLLAVGSLEGILLRISGVIQALESDGTFVLGVLENDDFIMMSLAQCKLGFDTPAVNLPDVLKKLLPKDWTSLLVLRFPKETTIMLFST